MSSAAENSISGLPMAVLHICSVDTLCVSACCSDHDQWRVTHYLIWWLYFIIWCSSRGGLWNCDGVSWRLQYHANVLVVRSFLTHSVSRGIMLIWMAGVNSSRTINQHASHINSSPATPFPPTSPHLNIASCSLVGGTGFCTQQSPWVRYVTS